MNKRSTAMDSNIKYEIIRSKRKTLGLEIKPSGQIIVRAPYYISMSQIKRFVAQHEEWINSKMLKIKENQKKPKLPAFTDDEINDLTKKAEEYIPVQASKYADIMGVHYNKITIKHQKTRWGSASAKGNLNFNCLLMLTPPEVCDSVIVHELAHLKEMNHSKRFYDEVKKVFADYDRCNKWLKENGGSLLARMR